MDASYRILRDLQAHDAKPEFSFLGDEVATVEWMHEQVSARAELPLLEAESVVRSLAVARHGDQEMLLPLLTLREFDEYTTTHSLNVSVLTMALAEELGMGARRARVRRGGTAARSR